MVQSTLLSLIVVCIPKNIVEYSYEYGCLNKRSYWDSCDSCDISFYHPINIKLEIATLPAHTR